MLPTAASDAWVYQPLAMRNKRDAPGNTTDESKSVILWGGVVNDQVHTMNFLYCHEDYKQARDIGVPMVTSFNITNAHLYWTREAYPTNAYQTLGNAGAGMKPKKPAPDDPSVAKGLPEGVGVGDPDHLVETIKRWESVGVTGINFLLNAMEMIPQEQVMESMRLFASEVMPQFRTKEERQSPVYTPATPPDFVKGEL